MTNRSSRQHNSLTRVAATAAFALLAAGAFAQNPPPAPPTPGAPMDHGAMGHDMKGMGGMGGMDHGAGGGGMAGMSHGGGGMGGMGQGGGGMGGGMMQKMLCGVTEHVDGRLAYLKAELKLTDQQQAAWNTFADAFRASTQKTAKVCAANEAAAAGGGDHSMHHGVLGHLTMMERHMSDHLDSLRGLKAAIEPLYATLNDEQKKTADHVFTQVMEIGMGKMGGGGMMGGMDHGAGGGGMGGMGH
jgi:hypothetical protein